MTSRIVKFHHPSNGWALVVEDNGRVAYAYLRDDTSRTVGDVWLYNTVETPDLPEWKDRKLLPFRNPRGYAENWLPPAPLSDADVRVVWGTSKVGSPSAAVYLWGELFAFLEPGA
jgi:hypothetical protein